MRQFWATTWNYKRPDGSQKAIDERPGAREMDLGEIRPVEHSGVSCNRRF